MMQHTTLADFTEDERTVINDITRRQFQNLTADEVALYAEWVRVNATITAELDAKKEALTLEVAESLKIRQATEQATINILNDMAAAAIKRLETVTNE